MSLPSDGESIEDYADGIEEQPEVKPRGKLFTERLEELSFMSGNKNVDESVDLFLQEAILSLREVNKPR